MKIDLRLLRLAINQSLLLALTILTGLAAGVLVVVQARIFSRVINLSYLSGLGLESLWSLLSWLLGLIFLRACLVWFSEVSAGELSLRVKSALRNRLFEHIQALGPAYIRGEESGELDNVLQEGVETLDAYFSQYLPQLALAALIPVTYLFFVFPLDWLSGLILLLTAPLIPIFMILIGSLAQNLTRRQWTALSRMSAFFLDVLQGLTTLKILGRSKAQAKVLAEVSDHFRRVTMGVLKVTFLSALALELVSTLSTAVVAVQVGLRLLYGRLEFEQALFVLLLAPEFYLPLRTLGTRFHAGMAGVTAAGRIFEILSRPVATANTEGDAKEAVKFQLNQAPKIRCENLSLEYEHRLVLDTVSFTLQPGQVTALVGPSGAGKSTLSELLLGFIQPTCGGIFLDGQPLSSLALEDWRKLLAWVPQNPYLFHESVLNNIRLGRPQASMEEVIQAARQAHAHEFIQAMPQGYATQIGEGGARLSGGQAQRIALARAFLRNAPVVILDEPTAHLDLVTERQVQEALAQLLVGRTVVVIAHRLSTVRAAHQILVLDRGRIVEQGQHNSLLAQGGLYASLLKAGGLIDMQVEGEKERLQPVRIAAPGEKRQARLEYSFEHQNPSRLLGAWLRLLSFLWPYSGLVGLSILAGFATIASSIGLMTASAYIISYAALAPSIAELQVAIVGVRFFGISRGLFRYGERYLSHQVTFRLLARLRVFFYQALEPLAPARLMAFHSGDLLARIMGDIESLENFYVRVVSPPVVAVLVSILSFVILAQYNPALGWILWAFLLLAGTGLPILAWLLGRKPGIAIVGSRSALSAAIIDGLQGLPDLAANNQLAHQAELARQLNNRLIQAQGVMLRVSALQSALASLFSQAGMWSILVYAIPLVEAGSMQGVFLAVAVLAALTSFEATAPLPVAAQYLGANLRAAQRLLEVVDAPPEVSDPPKTQAVPHALPGIHPATLQVQSVCFHYPEFSGASDLQSHLGKTSHGPAVEGIKAGGIRPSPQPVLDDVSLHLPYGKRLAILGPSGAGKSTLLNLLLSFWEFEEGQILLGGVDVHQMTAEAVRAQMAVIAQTTYLFSASLRDNLRIARLQATQDEIEQAVEQAGLQDFIRQLPQGYDTWIGEHGLRLSGGERQRLAIARALLKNAPILILDEATANLDSVTEQQIMDTILTHSQGCSLLMITHRLAFMQAMDEILLLDQGRVAARGSHAELLLASSLYRRMWDLQHGWLVDEA